MNAMRTGCVLALVAVGAAVGGCVERELTITSDPPGALVTVSSEAIGRTPVTTKFEWYGDYEVILRYEEKGYETLKTHAPINPPWYEIPPLDLFSQIAPWTYRDHRYLHYKLRKLQPSSEADLIKRAQEMEKRNEAPPK